MEQYKNNICIEELNPTFLFTWKGTRRRDKDEATFHSHDHLEMAFILSGEGKYRFDDGVISVKEGDLLIINPGVKHQALACPEAAAHYGVFCGGAGRQAARVSGQYASGARGRPCYAHCRGTASKVV